MTRRLSPPMPVEELRQRLSYDPATGEFAWISTPLKGTHRLGKVAGRMGTFGYRQIKLNQVNYMAHRLAWYYVTGKWPTSDVDHINCDRSDNRWSNLRLATPTQNAGNKRSRPGSSSTFKGVTWHAQCKKWQAQIECDGRAHYLGLHETEEAASLAYQEAAARLFGEFARVA